MIDTAGTICAAAEQLKAHGATKISVAASHGLCSEPAPARLASSPIDSVIVTDTVPINLDLKTPKIKILSVANLLAAAIKAIHDDGSISAIFGGSNQI
jgi:ribose-phosphate pyrophosphokinase